MRRKIYCRQCFARRKSRAKLAEELQSTADSSTRQAKLQVEENNSVDVSFSGCSTPKAKRFCIPEHLQCPPAPKKRRLSTFHCSSHKASISFFKPPELELFFLFAS